MKAFPRETYVRELSGMDLRDYFAAAALQGLLASPRPPAEKDADGYTTEIYAKLAYGTADAMMAARGVK